MNVDYTPMATPSVLNFTVGSMLTNNPNTSSFQCFTVPITNDTDVEPDENFILGLTNPTGLIVLDPNRPDSMATVTIVSENRKLWTIMLGIRDKCETIKLILYSVIVL